MNPQQQLLEALQKSPVFEGLNDTERRQVVEICRPEAFKPGDVIVRQGEHAQNLWVVLEGNCEVIRDVVHEGSPPQSVKLADVGPMNHFGEMSFFHSAASSANVVAKTPIKVVRIAHGDYQDLIDDGVAAAYKVAYNVVESLAARLRRMDEWVGELLTNECPDEIKPEWSTFRDKLFNGWTR